MSTLTPEQIRFFQTVDLASKVIGWGLQLVLEKNFFGKPKPTNNQVGYCYGFAETMADHNLNTNNMERAAFVQLVFGNLFGKSGDKFVRNLVDNQALFESSLARGADAFQGWVDRSENPLPPRD